MLSIMDPVSLENLDLYRDDEDPQKFYILPDRPVISINESGAPDFHFIKYKDIGDSAADDKVGGYVQFRTTLIIDPDRLQRVTDGLRALLAEEKAAGRMPFGLPITSTDPILASPVWTKGTCTLQTLAAGDKEMVRKASPTQDVDLSGALGASMNVQLDKDGAALFWSAFHDNQSTDIPILIAYQLSYRARISARMEIHADRKTVEQEIWKRTDPQPYRYVKPLQRWVALPFSGKLDKPALLNLQAAQPGQTIGAMVDPNRVQEALHSTITDGTITCNITTDQASGDDAAKVQDLLFKVATDVLSGRVIPAIFGENPTPQPATDNEEPQATPKQLVQLKVDTNTTSEARFDITLTSTSTIERQCNPNGALQVLVGDPQFLDDCFREVDLHDSFFNTLDVVAATAGVNFNGNDVLAVQLHFAYNEVDEANPRKPTVNHVSDPILQKATDTAHWHIDVARDAKGQPKRNYRYRTEVTYADPNIAAPILSEWITTSETMLLVRPATIGTVSVALSFTAPKEQVRAAHVTLRAQRPQGAPIVESITLTPDLRTKVWFQHTGQGGRSQQYDWQVTYDLATGGKIILPWTSDTREQLEIPGPFSDVYTFVFRPQGNFDGVQAITLDAVYEDPTHGYKLPPKSVMLDKPTASVSFDVPIMDGGPANIAWRNARVTYAGGAVRQLADGSGPPGTIWIGIPVLEYLSVEVRPEKLDFDKDVELAVIKLWHLDAAGKTDAQTTMTLTKLSHAFQTWRIPLSDGAPRNYNIDITYHAYDSAKNGHVQKTAIDDGVFVLERA